jgi:hypothetical protein
MPIRPPIVYSGRVSRQRDYFVCDTCGRASYGHAYKVGGPYPLRVYEECVECWLRPRMPYMPSLRGIRQ